MIDFLRANADGRRLAATSGQVSPVGYATPRFSAECSDGSSVSVDELKGHVIHIVLSASGGELAPLSDRAPGTDVRTIVFSRARIVPVGDICVGGAEEVEAYSVLRSGLDPNEPSEFLVDPAGLLRAAWRPGAAMDWRDPGAFRKIVDAVRTTPAQTRPVTASHIHH
jgi:hypothetical protein